MSESTQTGLFFGTWCCRRHGSTQIFKSVNSEFLSFLLLFLPGITFINIKINMRHDELLSAWSVLWKLGLALLLSIHDRS